MTESGRRRGQFAVLVLLVLVSYFPVLKSGGYIWDDDDYVTENPLLREEGGLARIWFEPSASPQYYPLVFTSFWIERSLFGDSAFSHHLVNLLLHALNAILVMLVLERLKLRGAFVAAALFAVHPVHVESVAWITERKNVLSAAFALLAFLALQRSEARASFRRLAYGAALFCFTLGLFAKTIIATLAPTILLLAWWRRGRILGKDWLRAAPFFLLGSLAGLMTAVTEVKGVRALGPEWDFSIAERLLIAGRALFFYAGKLLWPNPLLFNYERWQIDAGSFWQWLPPAAFVVICLLAILAARRGLIGRGPATAMLFFAGTLSPALGFLNVYPMRYSFVADHFQYLASLGLLVPAGFLLAGLRGQRTRTLGVGSLLVLLAMISWRQGRIYENQQVLWEATLEGNPESWMALNNLGMFELARGQGEEARRKLERAHDLAPHAREVLNNLGTLIYRQDGDAKRALDLFNRALVADPGYSDARTNLALMLVFTGRHEEALRECEHAIERAARVDREYPQARWIKARALHELDRNDDALVEINRVLEVLGPESEAQALRTEILDALNGFSSSSE